MKDTPTNRAILKALHSLASAQVKECQRHIRQGLPLASIIKETFQVLAERAGNELGVMDWRKGANEELGLTAARKRRRRR